MKKQDSRNCKEKSGRKWSQFYFMVFVNLMQIIGESVLFLFGTVLSVSFIKAEL